MDRKREDEEPEVASETAGDETEVEETDGDSAEPGEAPEDAEGSEDDAEEEPEEKPAKRTERKPAPEPEPEELEDDEDESPATDASSQFEQRVQAEAGRLANERRAILARMKDPAADRDQIILDLEENTQQSKRVELSVIAYGQRKHELEVFAMRLPKEDRAGFKKFANQFGHRAGDLQMLRMAYEGRKARASSKQVKATVDRAKKVIAAKDRGVVGTVKRPVTAVERKPGKGAPMTEAHYDREYDRLSAAGDQRGLLELSRRWAAQGEN